MMQPLYVTFLAPLNHYYSEEVRKWYCLHRRRSASIFQVKKLLDKAFKKATCVETAVNRLQNKNLSLNKNVLE